MEDADRNSAIDYEHTGDSLDSVPEVVQSLDAKTVPETALEERDNGTSESVNVAKPPPAARMSMAFGMRCAKNSFFFIARRLYLYGVLIFVLRCPLR